MNQKTCKQAYVTSSNGVVTIDAMTGAVLEVELYEGCELPNILHFDLDEYYRTYPDERREDVGDYDILDLGYTYLSETGAVCYEGPALDWRTEYARRLSQHNPNPEDELIALLSL
jgi:hypothetical protein